MSNRSEDDTSDPGEVAVASFLSEEKEAAGKVPLKSEQTDSSTESNHRHSDSSFAERKRRRYYAVREGCAMTVASVAVGVKIRSAIFLNWEDARQFVDALLSFPHEAEYAVFDSVDEAEDYLVEGEVEMRALNELNLSVGEAVAAGVAAASFSCNSSAIVPSIPPVNMNMKPTIPAARKRKRASVEKNKKPSNLKKYDEWDEMYYKLIDYKEMNNGSIDIPKISDLDKKDPVRKGLWALHCWCNSQYKNSDSLTPEKRQRLQQLGFQLAPPWDHMYQKLVHHKAENGNLEVSPKEEEELFEWTKKQKSMLAKHFAGKSTSLSNEQVKHLKSLGYDQSRPGIIRASGVVDSVAAEAKWNTMLEQLKAYAQRNDGKMVFPETKLLPRQSDRLIKNWVTEQRREFKNLHRGKNSKMSAIRLQRLTEVGFDFKPVSGFVPWEVRMESLRKFVEEHGHCRPPKNHPELGIFVNGIRQKYKEREGGKPNGLTDERVNELLALGFVFLAGKTPTRTPIKKTWDERFQDLVQFKEANGHTVVPQNSGPLGNWVRMQRVEYKRFRAGKKCNMSSERALKLSEVGFCFDASARFCGAGKQRIIDID